MKLYTAKTPKLVKLFFSNLIWEFSASEKIIYLTFDDGPIPEVTEWVLDELKKYSAKATFFCIGANVEKYSKIYRSILKDGHAIGNHTQQHVNAWKVSSEAYIKDLIEGQQTIEQFSKEYALPKKPLFRPPYGKITPMLSKKIRTLGYTIIMWDVLSGDFDTDLLAEKCLENVLKSTNPGSIIVFHDSIKANSKLKYVLPKVLEHFSNAGFRFEKIEL